MSSRSTHWRSAGASLAATMVLLSGCGSGGVTAPRIEDALAPTFANLIQLQRSILGLPDVDASAFARPATCHKLGQGKDVSGGGQLDVHHRLVSPGPQGSLA